MDSQVGNISGIGEVQKLLARELKHLGLKVEFIPNKSVGSAPLIMGSLHTHPGAPTVTFIGHSDVVTSPTRNPFRQVGNKLYGAGVADDKGGVFVCLQAIAQYLVMVPRPQININVLISPSEESGSIGFHEHFKAVGQTSDYVIGLEPALSTGNLITSRSGNRWYHLQVSGIPAHSGRFGNEYINAAHKLGLIIGQLHPLNDEAKLRRVNVGSLGGGNGGFNTICGDAYAKIDMRFSRFECRSHLHQSFDQILQETSLSCPVSAKQSQAFYSIEDDCPPLPKEETQSPWVQVILDKINSLEDALVAGQHAGGAADVNYFSRPGGRLLDGMGPVGFGLHTNNEHIEASSLTTRTLALSHFLQRLNFGSI